MVVVHDSYNALFRSYWDFLYRTQRDSISFGRNTIFSYVKIHENESTRRECTLGTSANIRS